MSTFRDRQQCLLLQLSAAERQHGPGRAPEPAPAAPGELDRRTYRRLRGEMRQFRGQESIFKRPEAPLSRCLRARRPPPPRAKDPAKWVHYSLEDVSAEDMSDATNTATALALLREMERRNLDATPMLCNTPDGDTDFKKPTFCISATIKKCEPDPPKVTFRNSRVVMPEYVVGVTEKRIKKKILKKEESRKRVELKLEHLYENDD